MLPFKMATIESVVEDGRENEKPIDREKVSVMSLFENLTVLQSARGTRGATRFL